MIRSKAIAKKCLECSNDSPKEVTLCHLFDCPLWEFRFGNSLKSRNFKERMGRAKLRYPEEFSKIKKIVKSDPSYIKNIPDKRIKAYVGAFLQINKG